jgi:PiT family inorganic phosphate transporter
LTWYVGIPSSSSHALIGGLGGAAFAAAGLAVFNWDGVLKITLSLLLAPLLGFLGGYFFLKLTLYLARGASPRINNYFRSLQSVTTVALALSHGSSNGQMVMGLITMGLVLLGFQSDFTVPLWVTALSAAALSLGVATGGYRIIRTLGAKMYRLRPIHGLDSQAAAATIIIGATLAGAPVSTTQVISTAILGAGAAERMRAIRWGVATQILTAWFVTIPVVAVSAGMLYLVLARLAPNS